MLGYIAITTQIYKKFFKYVLHTKYFLKMQVFNFLSYRYIQKEDRPTMHEVAYLLR